MQRSIQLNYYWAFLKRAINFQSTLNLWSVVYHPPALEQFKRPHSQILGWKCLPKSVVYGACVSLSLIVHRVQLQNKFNLFALFFQNLQSSTDHVKPLASRHYSTQYLSLGRDHWLFGRARCSIYLSGDIIGYLVVPDAVFTSLVRSLAIWWYSTQYLRLLRDRWLVDCTRRWSGPRMERCTGSRPCSW